MNRVKEFRLQAGLTQSELARRAGLNRNTISQLERKGSKLQKLTANCISSVLKVPASVLLGDQEEGYLWKSGKSSCPEHEGPYLVAHKPKCRKDYLFTVLAWKDNSWWMTSLAGETLVRVDPSSLWWSEINAPPI